MSEQPYRPLITRSIVDQGQFELTDIANAEVGKLVEEFDTAVNDAISSVGFAIAGFSYLRDHWAAVREQTGANNPGITLTTSDEGVGFYARWTVSEILEKTRHDGLAAGQLGAQLIVFLYTLWEDGFRKSFAKAHGCEARDFQVPVLGDLKLMRHDVIHHRSVASSENTGRCQVLRWFKPGEVPPRRLAVLRSRYALPVGDSRYPAQRVVGPVNDDRRGQRGPIAPISTAGPSEGSGEPTSSSAVAAICPRSLPTDR